MSESPCSFSSPVRLPYTYSCVTGPAAQIPTFPPPLGMSIFQVAAENVGYGLVGLFLLILAAFPGERRGVPRVILRWRPLAWLGLISYGIFLWHDRLIYVLADHGALKLIPGMPVVSMMITTLAVAIPLGAASWYCVARPGLRLKRSRRQAASRDVN